MRRVEVYVAISEEVMQAGTGWRQLVREAVGRKLGQMGRVERIERYLVDPYERHGSGIVGPRREGTHLVGVRARLA